jgi:DNA mismatch repair protein MutS2
LVGTPGESCALHIAARLGLPKQLVENARTRIVRRDAETQELMRKMRGAREAAERVRKDAEQKLVDLGKREDEAKARLHDLKLKSELIEAEAQRGLEERVREARRELARAFDLLPQVPGKSADAMRAALERADAQLSGAALSEKRRAFLDGLKKGSLVFIPRYKQRCVIVKVDRARGSVNVRLGAATLSVPFDEVTWYGAP